MKKRGTVIEVGAVVIIIITTLSIVVTYFLNDSPIYVGDSSTKHYIDYNKCRNQAKNISDENIVIFKTLEEAKEKEFKPIEGCV